MKRLLLLIFCVLSIISSSYASDDTNDADLASLLSLDTTTVQDNMLFTSECVQEDSKVKCILTPNIGIYIYKDSIKLDSNLVEFANLTLPEGEVHKDSSADKEVYTNSFEISFDILCAKQFDAIYISAQGCDANGICYPNKTYKYVIEKNVSKDLQTINNDLLFTEHDSFALILLLALVFGAALDLTPCSLPLLSIYSATILGTNSSKKDAIVNNASYCLSLALGYCIIGIIFSYIGVSAHGFLQHPVTCIVLSILLILLAIHTLDLLKLPAMPSFNAAVQNKLVTIKNGTVKKAVFMGLVSAIFTTPCTTAPLTGALIYVMTTNSIIKGGLIFFTIGLGMGLPLVIVGLFGSRALKVFKNKTSIIKKLLALPLIITALLVCKHLLGEYEQLVSIATYSICLFAFISLLLHKKFEHRKILIATIATLIFFTVGFIVQKTNKIQLPFEYITSVTDLNKYKGEKVYLTVSANWCTNCHALDRALYAKQEFIDLTQDYKLLRYDFTDVSTKESKDLAKLFNITGVPFAVILNEKGEVVKSYTGGIDTEKLEIDLK